MQIETKSLEDSKISVKATVDAKVVDEKIGAVYKELARRYNFPGFRKGKAPRPVIDNAVGKEAVLAQATEEVINAAYPLIIEDERLHPAGRPDFGDNDATVQTGKDFTFSFTLPVRPEIELSSYDAVEIELPKEDATEAEIDEQIEQLLAHYQQDKATDEWASETMGFENLEDMRKRIGENIADQKRMVLPRLKENLSLGELVERMDADAPEEMAEQKESELLQQFFTQLQRQEASFDSYLMQEGITPEQFKEDVKRQAADEVKRDLALDAWARHFKMEVTDDEIRHEFEIAAGADGAEKMQREWRESGRLYLIREELLRSKAMADILEKAKVTEVDVYKPAEKSGDKKKGAKNAKAGKGAKAGKADKSAEADADAKAAQDNAPASK